MTDERTAATDAEILRALQEKAEQYVLAVKDPATLTAKLAAYLVEKYPDRIETAAWLGVRMKDQGVEVKLWTAKLGGREFTAGALLGMKSIGADISTPVWRGEHAIVSIGAGVVTPFVDFGTFVPVLKASIRF